MSILTSDNPFALARTKEVKAQATIFLGLPCRPGIKEVGEIKCQRPLDKDTKFHIKFSRAMGSALNHNFNRLFARALNCRDDDNIVYFAMQHDDIQPEPGWIDRMVAILEDQPDIDILSCVIAIKDKRGLTSTAIQDVVSNRIRRITMTELIHLPPIFDARDCAKRGIKTDGTDVLLVNTGLWVCRFDRDWVTKFPGFNNGFDGIVPLASGKFSASFFPEDWTFSRWAHQAQLKVKATRVVSALHYDGGTPQEPYSGTPYRNDEVWGEWTEDKGDDQKN